MKDVEVGWWIHIRDVITGDHGCVMLDPWVETGH
jgi:hypothetical protein